MFDLAGFIRMRLENAGVLMIDDIGVDTYSDERFYSYRRSVHRKEPDYGRHVHAIALDERVVLLHASTPPCRAPGRFEIGQRRRQLLEGEFAIDHRPDRAAIHQGGDLAQLVAVRIR